MKHGRGASARAYCVVAVMIATAFLAASANNASCASSEEDLCPISQAVKDALAVSGRSPVWPGLSLSPVNFTETGE